MRNNETVLKELESTVVDANIDIDMKPYAVRGGFATRKTEALAALPRLREEYKERLLGNVIFLFVRGNAEKAQQLAEVFSQEGNAFFAVDADESYKLLADKIDFTIGQHREFTVHQYTIMNDGIEDLTKSAPRPLTIPSTAMQSLDSTPTKDDLIKYIRNLVTSVHGTALVEHHAGEGLVDQGLKGRFSGKLTALVVLNADERTEQGLVSMAKVSRTSVIDVDAVEAIDRAFAINVFKEAQKATKKTK